MKSFFQRHSGTHKPTSDSTPTYQIWLPPAIGSHDNEIRHRTIGEPLECTADVSRGDEKGGFSRTHHDSVRYIAGSGNNYTTYPSTGRDSHVPTNIQAAIPAATPSYPDPGHYLGGSAVRSTSQRPPAPMRSPSVEHTPTVHDAQHLKCSGNRYGDADKGGDWERRTRETKDNVARYDARVLERYGRRKDYVQHRDRDEDQRRVSDDERQRKDRRRNREKIKRDKEKESEGEGRVKRDGLRGRDKEHREVHRVREKGKDRNLDERQPTERDTGRDMTRDLRRRREQDEPRDRAEGNVDRRGKVREKDDRCAIPEREQELNGKGAANAGRCGISAVRKDLREERPCAISHLRELETEFKQSRQHDKIRELDQHERRRDVRKDKSYLDRRFEPGNAELDSASMLNSQPMKRHRYTPAHDDTNSDSLPRKGLPRLSKYKHNLAEVGAHHLSTMEKANSVPLALKEHALPRPRQITSPSSSRENQASYPTKLNYPSLPLGHHEKDMTLVPLEQVSRVNPSAIVTLPGDNGRSKHKEHVVETNPKNAILEFPPASSAREMLTHDNVELPDSNTSRLQYDEVSDSLSSRWPFSKKRSSSRPSPSIDNSNSMLRTEKQRLEEQLDHTITVPKTMYSNAPAQVAPREASDAIKYSARTVEKNSKLSSMDAPQFASLENPHMTHDLSNPNTHSMPSGYPAVTQASVVREPHMESHQSQRHRSEITISRTTDLQTSGELKVMQPYLQTRDQTSQILLTHVSRVPSDTPMVDVSRKCPESTGSKDQSLTTHLICETPNFSYPVAPVDDDISMTARTTSKRFQVEPTPEDIARGKLSQSHDTFPTGMNNMQSTSSTPLVGIRGSVAQSSVVLPSIRQSSARGQTAVVEDASLQIHSSFGSAIDSRVSQSAYHPSVMPNIATEHKVIQQFPIHLPNTRSIDDTINSKVSPNLYIPTQLPQARIQTKTMESPLFQQGQSESLPPTEIACSLPRPPTSRQPSSAEHLLQNVCKARTDRTILDNASCPQIQTSHDLQEATGSNSKARALPTSIEPSLTVGLNESTAYLQSNDNNMADEASIPTWPARTLDQAARYPVLTESGTTGSRSHSVVQQKKGTDMRAETVHSEQMPIALGAMNESNKISSHSAFMPPSQNAVQNQVFPPLNQAVFCDGIAGKSQETSTDVKMHTSPSRSTNPVIATKDINLSQGETPGVFGNVKTSSSTRDVIHTDSRYASTKWDDIGGVFISPVKNATVNSISMISDQITSDGPSKYRSSTESLAQPYTTKGQRIPSESEHSLSQLRTQCKASSIPNEGQSEATTQRLRPATAIGHRQFSAEGSTPIFTGITRDKTLISVIQRPATAMSSRHLPCERSRIHSALQAPSVQTRPLTLPQSRLTDPSDVLAPTHNREIASVQPTNKSDVNLLIHPGGALSKHIRTEFQSTSGHRPEDQSRKMQLQGQKSYLSTFGLEPEFPDQSLGYTHGAPAVQALPVNGSLVQHHLVSNTSSQGDKNVASSSQFQPTESTNYAIPASQGGQTPIQNTRLAELLSNDAPVYQRIPPPTALNDLESSRAVISKSSRSSVVKTGIEKLGNQTIQPEPTFLNEKRVTEKHSQEVDSRTLTVQKSTRVSEQFQYPQRHAPSMGIVTSTSQQSASGYSHTFPPMAEPTAQSPINQDYPVGSKSQKHIASRIGNPGPSSTLYIQKTQTPPHTHDNQTKALRKGTVELSPRTQSLPANKTYPVGITQITSHHQTSQRTARNKDQSKISQKHNPVIQSSHTVSFDTAGPNKSSTSGGPSLTVSASHKSSHQQYQGIPSIRDNDSYSSSHKLAVASSSKHFVPASNSRSDVPSTQQLEPASHKSRSTTPVNNPSSSQVDVMFNRYVPSSSQVPQPSLESNVSVASHIVSSSIKPRSTSRNHGKTAMRSAAVISPSNSPPDKQRPTAPDVPSTFQPITLQQPPTTSSLPQDLAPSRNKREVSRKPSEDSVLLRTPSSLTPTILKASASRTSIPASFSSQTSSKKRGLFSMFRSRLSQSPDQVEESQKPAPRKLRKEPKSRVEKLSDAAPSPDIKVTTATSSRAKVPPITIPTTVQPVTERRSPNKVFTPFRYLTTKRNRRVSQASVEAQDGTAPNTVIGSPTASIQSSQPPPIQAPPLRDVLAATQEWRRMEAAEARKMTGGKMRRARPGVVFDVAEDHTEEDRPKIRPQNRQS